MPPPLHRRLRRAGALAALVLAPIGCTAGEPTEIFLTVDSDLVVHDAEDRREVDAIRVRVLRLLEDQGEAELHRERRGDLPRDLAPGARVRIDDYVYEHRWSYDFPLGSRTLPIEIGVAPEGRDAARTAYFEAVALRSGRVLTRTAVRTRFVQGRSIRVIVWLTASCLDVECEPESVCRDGSCVSVEVAADCLPSARMDAGFGPTGCSLDASTPERDAAIDPCDASCGAGEACVGGRCVPAECEPACGTDEVCAAGACVPASTDVDGDGLSAAMDCDDADPAVGETASRACTAACGMGNEECTTGAWTACDGPDVGATTSVACGNCGTQAQRCEVGGWSNEGTCMDQGCRPGSRDTESRSCSCGGTQTRSRTCSSACTWGAFGSWSSCPSCCECSPGATETQNQSCGNCGRGTQSQRRTCGSDCRWGGWSGWGACTGEQCAPGACECCDTETWHCCDPSTCMWFGCQDQPACGT